MAAFPKSKHMCSFPLHAITPQKFIRLFKLLPRYSTVINYNLPPTSFNENIIVTGFGKTDQVVTFCISRNTVLKH